MHNKAEIVDWIVNNEALMVEVLENVRKRLIKNEYLFDVDIREQYVREVQQTISVELGRSLGVALEQFHEHITPDMIDKFIDYVEKK